MRRLTGVRAYRAWRPSALVVAFAVGALLVIAACGGEKKGEATGTTAGMGEASGGAKLVVELDDFYFKPDKLSLTAGQAVILELENEGKAEHTFTVADLGIDVTVQPGRTEKLVLTPAQGGSFRLVCRFHGAGGMVATVSVAGGAISAPAGAAPASPTPDTSMSPYQY